MADSDIQPTGSDEEEEVPELDPEQQEQAQASFFDAQDTTGQQQGRLCVCVCVCVCTGLQLGRAFPTIGVSTRRAGLPPKPPPQGILIPTLGTVPRLLYMYRNFRPPKRQRRGTMASFQDLGKLAPRLGSVSFHSRSLRRYPDRH